jgi:hypothetical protein
MNTNQVTTRLSVSGMRRYAACGYAYKLHQNGAPRRIPSAVWYGGIVHRIIQRAYAGAALMDAHGEVWAEECGSILGVLDRWSDLHVAYQRSGNPHTKARAAWLVANPRYGELAEQLAQYQAEVLSIYAWSKTASVQTYFLQSRTLLREHGDEIVLPHAVMVEGDIVAALPTEPKVTLDVDVTDDDDKPRSYRLLEATIGATTVVGVPDVVTYNAGADTWRIADYKTSRTVVSPEAVREDAQLNVYLILLHQAGIIPAGANVVIGHIYLSDHVEAVWVDASDLVGRQPRRLVEQIEQTRAMINAGIFVPVRGLLNGYADRCAGCMFAAVCDA